jgi:hypothetical protein
VVVAAAWVAWATWGCKRSVYAFIDPSKGPGGKLPGLFVLRDIASAATAG